MAIDPGSARYGLSSLTAKRVLPRLALIGVIVLCVAAAFVWTGGWLSAYRLTAARMIDTFERADGPHPGFRRNHAKGVCALGNFAGNGQAVRLSRAGVFQAGSVPVIARFALAGGNPFLTDNPRSVRSLAVSFRPPGGDEWRSGMNDIPVFPVATPKAFHDLLVATAPDPATGKPDPARLKAFFAANPASARALQIMGSKPFSTGFANASYNSLDAFRFVNAEGTVTPVRWAMVAADPFVAETPGQVVPDDKNYLFDALAQRLKQGAAQWHLIVTIGQPGDPTSDATIPWPDQREHVDAGTLTIDRIEAEAPGNCQDINYDPLVLPEGIEPSDDPLLSARSAAYANSFARRAGESKPPSAVQPGDAGKGS